MGVIPLRLQTARVDEMAQGPGVDKKGSLEHSLAKGQRRARGQNRWEAAACGVWAAREVCPSGGGGGVPV